MGYFNRGAFGSLDEFLDVLDAFLAAWPHRQVPLAVEIRNPRWVVPELAEVLRDHDDRPDPDRAEVDAHARRDRRADRPGHRPVLRSSG